MLRAREEIRPATKLDADAMSRLIDLAGEGLPMHFWKKLAGKDEDPFAVGMARACREEGSFSYRNGFVAEENGKAAALLITYRIGSDAEPVEPASTPAPFVPLLELENLALDTQYVNVLATLPEYRRHGHGTRLLARAATLAAGSSLSIIVSDANAGAIRLYKACGYRMSASRPIVTEAGWSCRGENWLLMRTDA